MKKVFAAALSLLLLCACAAPVFASAEDAGNAVAVGSYNGQALYFTDFTNCAFGSWICEDGVMRASELSNFTLLRLEKNLGNTYTVEYDVKQEDTNSGWQTIMTGFDVSEGENLTQSGYVLDLHNAGVGRVIVYGKANAGADQQGSYASPYCGFDFSKSTDWIHVKIERAGNDFTVSVNDGTEKTARFTDGTQTGGYLCLGAVGDRVISYKNVTVTSTEEIIKAPVAARVRAVEAETIAGGGNTFNGEPIAFSEWRSVGFTDWDEQNGILSPVDLNDFTFISYDRALGDTYTIELDVRQREVSTGWNTIMIGFDVNEGENLTTSGLTLDLHNAGVWRVIDWKNANNNAVAMGNYGNPFGGTLPYTCTTQWMHVKIVREGAYYTVYVDDGNPQMSRFETDQFNGGHLVISAVGKRDVMFKNIAIKDTVEVELGELAYPEDIGTATYRFDGNAYGEWVFADPTAWTADGANFTQTLTQGEQTAYLDTDPIRNFRLAFDYEVMSEEGGAFGVGFRKKRGENSYKKLGQSLLFDMSEKGDKMTLADYTASGGAGIDGKVHLFEPAGHVVVEASGNQFHVWLDDELIINARDNSYAFGYLAFFTENCSVEFSDIEIVSDYLTTDDCKRVLADAAIDGGVTPDTVAAYAGLSDFQKSLLPRGVRESVERFAGE